jgi:uncharacterized membrane protein YphA (DoxX/SURF4 family)
MGKRIGVRFLFIYFVLYVLPFPFEYVPAAGPWIEERWNAMWVALVVRVAKSILARPLAMGTAGSSDMTWNYIQIGCFIVIAAIGASIWSLVDRKRPNVRVHQYLYAYLRFALASAMLWYGIQKVIPAQFPPPSLDRLVQTYGSSAPMGMLWTFMGVSPGYEIFAGAAELLAGLLLLARRTALLGALATIAVMSNVVALNFSFDGSIKTYSSDLLLLAVFLAAPDARNVAGFFLRRPPAPLFEKRWARIGSVALAALLAVTFLYTGFRTTLEYSREHLSLDHRSPLRGIWNVDVLDVDGIARPPLVTDAARWRRVVFDYQGQSSIFLMNDERNLYRTKLDEAKKTIDFANRYDKQDAFRLAYARPDPSTLRLDGLVAGHRMHAVCRLDPVRFRLTTRGFHWINERALMR